MTEFLADEYGQVCCGAELGFASPCSEPPSEGKPHVICDRHEVERRAASCGISPRQWLRNTGGDDLIATLFPDADLWYEHCPAGHEYVPDLPDCPVCESTGRWAVFEAEQILTEGM